MKDEVTLNIPAAYRQIDGATRELGFTMASDILTCSLLRTLAASKPNGKFLEMGTGTSLATSWILDGMGAQSTMISFDNNAELLNIAQNYLGVDSRIKLECIDGEQWINDNADKKFDYIFADTWHGKYLMLDETLSMLNTGGLYIIDDMIPQANWPEGHHEKANRLLDYLDSREDLILTRQVWATGIVVAVKK